MALPLIQMLQLIIYPHLLYNRLLRQGPLRQEDLVAIQEWVPSQYKNVHLHEVEYSHWPYDRFHGPTSRHN